MIQLNFKTNINQAETIKSLQVYRHKRTQLKCYLSKMIELNE